MLTLEAFAKVNRSLLVLGRRPDGYHELATLYETVDLSDRLWLEEAGELTLECDDPSVPTGESNLVLRAARLLAAEAGVPARGRLRLSKRIPAGGGLGGGSSDAVAALRGLAALWAVGPGPDDLDRLAAGLGSDVPFFLHGGRARGTGRGEVVTPLPDRSRPEWLLLVFPPFAMATPEVYRARGAPGLTGGGAPPNLSTSVPVEFPDRNDLEAAAERLRPELRNLRRRLLDLGARSARLSGSGSTVFGVFRDADEAETARRGLVDGLPEGTRTGTAATLPRPEFDRRSAPEAVPGGGAEATRGGSRWGVDKW